MTDISYSPMTASDIESVLELWRQTDGVGLNESDTPEKLLAYLDRNPNLSLIARDGSRLIGAVLSGHDGRRGYLHHLAVVAAHRGRGVGRKMVETCLSSLSGLGILKCNIFLYVDNDAGQRFWDRCGWSARRDLQVLQRITCQE
jgi:ribosomal protein S18 acetylase RimI-like enzyme